MSILLRLRSSCEKGKGECYWFAPIGIEEKTYYEPPILLPFEGKEYYAPREYDGLLTKLYGNYMELPPIEKRITHNPVRISFDTEGPDEEL